MDYTKDTSNFNKSQTSTYTNSTYSYDVGLRNHMLLIYQQMFFALLITSLVAGFVSYSPSLWTIVHGPLGILLMIATIIIPVYFTLKINQMSLSKARGLLFSYAALMGASLSYILAIFGPMTTFKAFVSTGGMFGATCLYGYTTKSDLSQYRHIFFMALIGILIASLINIFTKSSAIEFMISAAGVVIFAGITAYDTQKAKDVYYYMSGDQISRSKAAVFCALSLYMDFINMFVYMVRLFGRTRD
ncbi:Bax inhibitor-1/YccA family protein [Lyticum sinuosum]|uniref:Bax inhibitor-1/YccA family protein n=1 Tax=Lyticum sinuosum TaxID=1332059 RepID=A0AAE4VKS1_9RICK|nr:Bax inhibitor-1/YccA family protein [Lyticum sinuosum]MDZ5761390.1 Bax inhibitor-1/YccA family protein [Lyticum sinuosum]